MRQAGVSVPPEALWSDHEWQDNPARHDAPANARQSGPAPRQRGVPVRPGVTPPKLSRANIPERPARGGPARPGARAPGSVTRGVPDRSGVAAPIRSRTDDPGRPARGDSPGVPASARSAPRASAPSPPAVAPRPGAGVPGRRTVTIRGRGSERNLIYSSQRPRRRPRERAHERAGFRPDRVAMWAVLLGLLLILVAATSSHAAIQPRPATSSHAAIRPLPVSASSAAVHQHLSRPAQIRVLER